MLVADDPVVERIAVGIDGIAEQDQVLDEIRQRDRRIGGRDHCIDAATGLFHQLDRSQAVGELIGVVTRQADIREKDVAGDHDVVVALGTELDRLRHVTSPDADCQPPGTTRQSSRHCSPSDQRPMPPVSHHVTVKSSAVSAGWVPTPNTAICTAAPAPLPSAS